MKNKFIVEEAIDNFIIVDIEGIDDYYHLGNDIDDIKKICEMLNDYENNNQKLLKLSKENDELKQILKIILDIKTVKKFNNIKDIIKYELLNLKFDKKMENFIDYILLKHIYIEYYNDNII